MMVQTAIVEQRRPWLTCWCGMPISMCIVAWLGQRALAAAYARHKEDMSIISHRLNLSQENDMIPTGIFCCHSCIKKAHRSCQNRRSCCGCGVFCMTKVDITFL